MEIIRHRFSDAPLDEVIPRIFSYLRCVKNASRIIPQTESQNEKAVQLSVGEKLSQMKIHMRKCGKHLEDCTQEFQEEYIKLLREEKEKIQTLIEFVGKLELSEKSRSNWVESLRSNPDVFSFIEACLKNAS